MHYSRAGSARADRSQNCAPFRLLRNRVGCANSMTGLVGNDVEVLGPRDSTLECKKPGKGPCGLPAAHNSLLVSGLGASSHEKKVRGSVALMTDPRTLRLVTCASVRGRLREPMDHQGCTNGAALDGGDLQVLVIGVRTTALGAEAVDADRVRRHELHVARAAQRGIEGVDAAQARVLAGL